MAKQVINVGTSANDGTGDKIRVAFQKTNANFTELYDTKLDDAPSDGIIYGRQDADWVEVTGGGSQDLQQVTDGIGNNETTNDIRIIDGLGNILVALSTDLPYGFVKVNSSDGLQTSNFYPNFISCNGNIQGEYFIINVSGTQLLLKADLLGGASKTQQYSNESGDLTLITPKTSNFTAVNSVLYTANGTLTVTDPTGVTNKGYIVHVIGGTTTIGGVGYTTGALVYRFYNGSSWASKDYGAGGSSGTVTSVALTMPTAFSVANSPVTTSGTLDVTAIGTASQYIRGDGTLATLPSGASGGSSISYYLNGGTAASVGTYYQMSKIPVIGTGVDFSLAGNGLISQWLTDLADPNRLEIPAGNWNFEMYMSASSAGGTPAFYVELLKYNGTTFTTIANSSAVPEAITGGTSIDLYLTSLAIPQTTLLVTDRLAIRVYIVNSTGGRTITMHTQDSHLCQIITNFAGGVTSLNGLTDNTQYFDEGTSGTDFNISSITDTHTFNLPTASATNRGALSSADWSTFNGKQPFAVATTGAVISFATPQIYNTFTSPTALDITDSLGTAKIGVVQKIYSNKSVEPTYPAGWKKLFGTYTNGVPNIIYCEWVEGSRVEYWIVTATV